MRALIFQRSFSSLRQRPAHFVTLPKSIKQFIQFQNAALKLPLPDSFLQIHKEFNNVSFIKTLTLIKDAKSDEVLYGKGVAGVLLSSVAISFGFQKAFELIRVLFNKSHSTVSSPISFNTLVESLRLVNLPVPISFEPVSNLNVFCSNDFVIDSEILRIFLNWCYFKDIELSELETSQVVDLMKSKNINCSVCYAFLSLLSSFTKKNVQFLGREILNLHGVSHTQDFRVVIESLCEKGDLINAHSVFDIMMAKKIDPNYFVYHLLIRGYVFEGNISKAELIFKLMNDSKTEPSIHIMNSLIAGYSITSDLDSIINKIKGLREYFLVPNFLTFRILCSAYYKSRKRDMIKKSASKSLSAILLDADISLDIDTLNLLINEAGRHGDLDTAISLFNVISDLGMVPNQYTYSRLIILYCKFKDMPKALDTFKKLIKTDYQPNKYVFTTLIKGLSDPAYNDMRSALIFFHKQLDYGIEPDVHVINTLISGFCKNGQLESAVSWYNKLSMYNLTPDILVITTLISGYANVGDLNGAEFWFNKISELRLKPSVGAITSMIKACCISGDFKMAEHWLSRFAEFQHVPNTVAFNILIKSYCSVFDFESALNMFKKLEVYGLNPDIHTISAFIDSYCKNEDYENAALWFQKINQFELEPNDDILATLICNSGKMFESGDLSEKLSNFAVKPSVSLINSIMNAYRKAGNHAEVLSWSRRLKDFGLKPSSQIFLTLIKSSLSQKKPFEAIRILDSIPNVLKCVPFPKCYEIILQYCQKNNLPALIRDLDHVMSSWESKLSQ